MKKIILLAILGLIVAACATTPEDRFPLIYEDPLKAKKINVLIDTMVYSDIQGSDIGFNVMKNDDLLAVVEQQIVPKFEERGYQITIVRSGIGLLHHMGEQNDGKEIAHLISVDGQATEELWPGPQAMDDKDPFMDEKTRTYLRGLLDYAKFVGITHGNTREKRQAKEGFYALEKPLFLEDESLETLVIVRAVIQEVGEGKAIGSALLTGLLSAALSGGTYIYMSMPTTTLHFDVVFLDTETEEVIWHGSSSLGGKINSLPHHADMVLQQLPAREGAAVDMETEPVFLEEGG